MKGRGKVKQDHFEVILEDINGKLDAVVEGYQGIVVRVNSIDERLENMESSLRTLTSVLTVHNNDIKDLKAIHPNMRHAS